MTEKRFTMNEDGYIWDNKEPISQETVLIRLNALHEENEQLKQTVSDWSGSYDELFEDVKRLEGENEHIKNTIKEAYHNERTMIGQSVLKQLLEAIQ